ncbi:hypothetical protein MY8738_006627 [Beauveria namnaoensis]
MAVLAEAGWDKITATPVKAWLDFPGLDSKFKCRASQLASRSDINRLSVSSERIPSTPGPMVRTKVRERCFAGFTLG